MTAPSEILRAAGFDNISMDLIAGLPHQTRESWDDSVAEILRLRPEHISIYMLEIDEGSPLGKESLAGGSRYSAATIPSDDAQTEFYEFACARLAAAGYDHYEISNWALPNCRSRHNLKYWQREPYLGLGAGAHSFDGQHAGPTPTIPPPMSRQSNKAAHRASRSNSSRRSKLWKKNSSSAFVNSTE